MPENDLMEGLMPYGLMGPPKLSSCVGLFISPDAVHLAAAGFSGGKPTIAKVVSVPMAKPAAPLEGAPPENPNKKRTFFNTDFLSSKEILAGALAAGLQELGARTKDVVITLAPQISITRYFLMPPVNKRFWKAAVPSEAKKYIPFPLDGLLNDFQVAPPVSEAKKNLLGVLFGVTPQLSMNQILGVVRAQGLNPIAMEPSHCSVMRYWAAAGSLGDGQAQVRVHFDPDRAYIILTSQGLPLLCREVDLPSDEYALSQKKLDLAGALDFSERYLGIEQVGRVRITGAANEARNAMISREVELPIEKELGPIANMAEPRWGTFAAAGAGLRSLSGSSIVVDFTQTGRMRDEDKTLLLIWGAGFAVFIIFTLLALFNEYQIVTNKQQLSQLTRKAAAAGVTQGMTATDLRSKIDKMKTLDTTMESMSGKDNLALKLQQLVDDIPDHTWLESVQYADPLVPGDSSKKTLGVTGAIETGTRESDILEGNQFKDGLQKDPMFFKGFAQIDISYSGSGGGASASGGPEQSGGGPEKKTAFTLNAGPPPKS